MSNDYISRMAASNLLLQRGHAMRDKGAAPFSNPRVQRAGDHGMCDIASQSNAAFADGPLGILEWAVDSGNEAVIRIRGQAIAACGSSVSVGKMLTCNTSGRLIEAAVNDITFCRAEEGGSSGKMIRVECFPPHRLQGNN